MFSNTEHSKKIGIFLIITGFILILFWGYGLYSTLEYNNQKNRVTIYSSDKDVSVKIKTNTVDSDIWETAMQLTDDPENLEIFKGETCSCVVENTRKFSIKDWTLTIRIVQDCYLNGFWCGDFEIHQFRDDEEIVELVKNGKINPADLKVEHNVYSTTPLIHLIPGDYLVYHPSVEVQENIIKPNSSIGIGFIFYYKDYLDFSSYELFYKNDLKMIDSVHFDIALFFIILWLLIFVYYVSFALARKKYVKEMNNSIKSLSFMVDLYHEVHMINVAADTGYLIRGTNMDSMFSFVGSRVSVFFKKYIEKDCVPSYRKDLANFLDLNATLELLKDTASVDFEYESISRGWCSLRFFKIEKQGCITNLVFTVQDINEDKLNAIEERERLRKNEYSELIRNSFLVTITYAINGMLGDIQKANQEIQNNLNSKDVKEKTEKINSFVEHLRILQLCLSDMHDIEAESLKIKENQYNLNELIKRLIDMHKPFIENKAFEFQTSISSDIPESLTGDENRLIEILALILYSAINITSKGYVKLSVYAKKRENTEELLFSIRDTGCGFTKDEMKEIHSFIAGTSITSFDNPVLVFIKIIDSILRKMGSELKIVSEFGSGTEFYFTLIQKIVEQK